MREATTKSARHTPANFQGTRAESSSSGGADLVTDRVHRRSEPPIAAFIAGVQRCFHSSDPLALFSMCQLLFLAPMRCPPHVFRLGTIPYRGERGACLLRAGLYRAPLAMGVSCLELCKSPGSSFVAVGSCPNPPYVRSHVSLRGRGLAGDCRRISVACSPPYYEELVPRAEHAESGCGFSRQDLRAHAVCPPRALPSPVQLQNLEPPSRRWL